MVTGGGTDEGSQKVQTSSSKLSTKDVMYKHDKCNKMLTLINVINTPVCYTQRC